VDTLSMTGGSADEAARARGGGAVLVVALELERPAMGSSRHLLRDVDEVVLVRGEERGSERVVEGKTRRLVVRAPDARMSSQHARIVRAGEGWRVEDLGSKNGTWVNGAAVDGASLRDGDLVEVGQTFLLFRDAGAPEDAAAPLDVDTRDLGGTPPGLVTFAPVFARELDNLARVATTQLPVLILGETGTGKELAARAVHALSRRSGPFLPVNCGALAPTIVESEFFGYKRGAFSGANEDRPGLVRAADGGTMFLDEIGDLTASSQATLLRVLQEREVLPVGATKPIPVDVRVVAATHRDLDVMAARGAFREDLLARLAGFTLTVPPLASRIEDLGLLIAALLQRLFGDGAAGVRFTPAAARALFAYRWPHNVRELEHCLAAATALAGDDPIDARHLWATVSRRPTGRGSVSRSSPPVEAAPANEAEIRARLVALLAEHRGNVAEVARAMGKARMQIHRWVKRFGLSLETFRQP
jgi:DNA-binding NtrC family response regulator